MKKHKDWLNPKVVVKNPSIHRKGLFAKKPIKKGETVLKYGGWEVGRIVSWLSHMLIGDYGWQLSQDRFLAPLSKQDLGAVDYINHSCNPNLGLKGERSLIALRDIKSAEELTFDYAMLTTNEPYSFLAFLFPYCFNCFCGSKSCRKIVSGEDWKRKDLQTKYSGYFSPYLTRKIKQLINYQ